MNIFTFTDIQMKKSRIMMHLKSNGQPYTVNI